MRCAYLSHTFVVPVAFVRLPPLAWASRFVLCLFRKYNLSDLGSEHKTFQRPMICFLTYQALCRVLLWRKSHLCCSHFSSAISQECSFEVLQYLQSFDSQLLCLQRRNHINQGVSSHVQRHPQAMITYPDAAVVQIPTPNLSGLLVFCSEWNVQVSERLNVFFQLIWNSSTGELFLTLRIANCIFYSKKTNVATLNWSWLVTASNVHSWKSEKLKSVVRF